MKDVVELKWYRKKYNSMTNNIPFYLTIGDYQQLLDEAGITAENVGHDGYHLARYGDQGGYEIGNCRFVTCTVNIRERAISEKMIEVNREKARMWSENKTDEQRSEHARLGGLAGGGRNKLTQIEIDERINTINESGIDVLKYGWVLKVSELLNVSHTQVRRFMDKYYPYDFYRR